MTIRGAPLDYLRSTLLFRGDELNVADVQATRDGDYLSGRGSISLAGALTYQGELQLAVADPGLYAPALAGMIDLDKVELFAGSLQAPVRLESVFCGPGPDGKPVAVTFGSVHPFPGPLAVTGGRHSVGPRLTVDLLNRQIRGSRSRPDDGNYESRSGTTR